MCCRLNIDHFKFNSFGGGGLKLGSFRVITLNLPKMALVSYHKKRNFLSHITIFLDYAKKLLKIERIILKEKIAQGFLKFFKMGWYDLDRMFFGTLSFHGLPDSVEHLWGTSIDETVSQDLVNNIIDLFLESASEEKDFNINVEQAPAESATATMASFNNDGREFYSNQFVPLEFPISADKRIEIEGMFSDRLTGGSMCFINLDSAMDEEQSLQLHEYIYRNSMINQWCPNYGWSLCEDCKELMVGEHEECKCGSFNIKYFERVVGYLVDRDVVNAGREVEMLNRVRY